MPQRRGDPAALGNLGDISDSWPSPHHSWVSGNTLRMLLLLLVNIPMRTKLNIGPGLNTTSCLTTRGRDNLEVYPKETILRSQKSLIPLQLEKPLTLRSNQLD